jgi:hypothetical protein
MRASDKGDQTAIARYLYPKIAASSWGLGLSFAIKLNQVLTFELHHLVPSN